MLNSNTRTFTAAYPIFLDDAVIAHATHTITVTGYDKGIQFAVDGRPVSTLQADGIRQLALSRGTFERVSGPEMQPIGKVIACQLHRDMARLGVTRHYQTASEALGYLVSTLAALSRQEAQDVWSYTCALAERPTLPSVVFGMVAA